MREPELDKQIKRNRRLRHVDSDSRFTRNDRHNNALSNSPGSNHSPCPKYSREFRGEWDWLSEWWGSD